MTPSPRTARFLALIVAAAFFMENLDGTVIATALPQMARSFGVSPSYLSISMTAYLVTLAVFIPVSGWVADRFGTRTVFGGAIGVFTLASILCGLSGNATIFTAMRVLQGVGGAMMVPVGRMVVLRGTEKSELLRSISTITTPGLVAPVIGPPLGGFITTYASWRWIFLLNVPIGAVGMLLVWLLVPNFRAEQRKPLDGVGFLLSGLALSLLMYGTELAGRENAIWSLTVAFLAAATVFGGLAVWHGTRAAHPLIDYSTLRVPTFSVTILSGSLTRIAISVAPFLVPLMFQVGFGMNAFRSGLLFLASAAGNLGMKSITTRILRRFGFRTVMVTNTLVVAVSFAACGLLMPDTPVPLIVLLMLVCGCSRSMQFTCLSTLAFADIPPPQMAAASTLFSTVQQMAMGMGIAFGAVALHAALLLHTGAARYSLPEFRIAFGLVGLLALASLPGYLRLHRDAGVGVSGHQRPRPASAA
jgi:EmrB/QacA subfamily drug resistance transporter